MGKEFEEDEEDEHKRKKRGSEDGDGADEDEVFIDLINLSYGGYRKIFNMTGVCLSVLWGSPESGIIFDAQNHILGKQIAEF